MKIGSEYKSLSNLLYDISMTVAKSKPKFEVNTVFENLSKCNFDANFWCETLQMFIYKLFFASLTMMYIVHTSNNFEWNRRGLSEARAESV